MPQLIASAKPGVHQVKVFSCYIKKSGYLKATKIYSVKKFVYCRIRKKTAEPMPSEKSVLRAILKLAHERLSLAKQGWEEQNHL